MLTVLLASLGAFASAALLMGAGALAGREPLRGSCGGLGRLVPGLSCLFCGGKDGGGEGGGRREDA